MLKEFVKHVATKTGLNEAQSRFAIGVVLNAAERQGSAFSEFLFQKIPGVRTLSAQAGSDIGAATGVIARLIEQTPAGRSAVAFQMVTDLTRNGLGPNQIGELMPSISEFAKARLGYRGTGHLADFIGAGEALKGVRAA